MQSVAILKATYYLLQIFNLNAPTRYATGERGMEGGVGKEGESEGGIQIQK